MDEERERRISIARELATWAGVIPRLVHKMDEILGLPHVSEDQALAIEQITNNIGILYRSLRQAHEKKDYERMIASSDRLREEIQSANGTLDQMLMPTPPS
jgi:hypothetical protein